MATRTPRKPSDFIGPILLLAAIGLLVHVLRHPTGTLFDDENVGATIVLGGAAILTLIVGGFKTRSALRDVGLRAPCANCGSVADRQFQNPADPRSLPTQCGTCIAYLRATPGDDVLEETDTRVQHLALKFPYALSVDQYGPAVKHTNRSYFKFEMPTMCAACGDPHAKHKREIKNGDYFGPDIFDAMNAGRAGGQIGSVSSAPTQDDKNSRGLSNLKAPVCDKHTEDADPFDDVIQYSSGKLEFTSYGYYKAFCELNSITRASVKARR